MLLGAIGFSISLEPWPRFVSRSIDVPATKLDIICCILCIIIGCVVRVRPEARALKRSLEALNPDYGKEEPKKANQEGHIYQ